MKQFRRWFQTNVVPLLIYGVLRLLYLTLRVTVIGNEPTDALHRCKEGVVYVLWHARLIMAPFASRREECHALISIHRDGEMIARVLKLFGYGVVRGSSSRGGEEALKEMVRLAQENRDLAITPDGPKGPVEVAKPGAAQVARLTGRPVVPFAYAASRVKRFNSWDRFMLPLPFARVVFIYGEPLYCREGEETETFRQRIEQSLRAITRQADLIYR